MAAKGKLIKAKAKPKAAAKKSPPKKCAAGKQAPRKLLSEDFIAGLIAKMIDGDKPKSMKEVCKAAQVSYTNIVDRISAAPRLTELYARTREAMAELMVGQLDQIASQEVDVQRARLKCDNTKWYAARILPKQYGDRVQVEAKVEARTMTDEQLDAKILELAASLGIGKPQG